MVAGHATARISAGPEWPRSWNNARPVGLGALQDAVDTWRTAREHHLSSSTPYAAQRLLLAADAEHGQAAVDRLYTAIGEQIHDDGAELSADVLVKALIVAGLPAALADAADDERWDAQIRESHEAAQARVGAETGSPVLAIGDGPGFFGPVAVPTGADADRLFDAVTLLASVPQFSELKRSRNSF